MGNQLLYCVKPLLLFYKLEFLLFYLVTQGSRHKVEGLIRVKAGM
jgi:hypothetical protein